MVLLGFDLRARLLLCLHSQDVLLKIACRLELFYVVPERLAEWLVI